MLGKPCKFYHTCLKGSEISLKTEKMIEDEMLASNCEVLLIDLILCL